MVAAAEASRKALEATINAVAAAEDLAPTDDEVADELGVTIDRIAVIQGDTDTCPYGFGNYSGRSIVSGEVKRPTLTTGLLVTLLTHDIAASSPASWVNREVPIS